MKSIQSSWEYSRDMDASGDGVLLLVKSGAGPSFFSLESNGWAICVAKARECIDEGHYCTNEFNE